MGYPLDLDEMDENKLRDELTMREHRRSQNKCDYCNRVPETTPCKMGERHVYREPPTRLMIRISLDEAVKLRRVLTKVKKQPEFQPLAARLLYLLGD